MLGVYTIVKPAAEDGWGSGEALALGAASLVLLVAFIAREATARNPLVPLRIFRSRNVSGANVIQALTVAGMFGMFFLGALYLQRVLGYDALETGLAFLPTTIVMGVLTVRYSEPLIMRFGARTMLFPGLALIAVGLALFTLAGPDGGYLVHVLPVILLIGIGVAVCFPALMTLAMSGATPEDAGLASGLINTTAQVGGALGLAVLATVSASRTDSLIDEGEAARLRADERIPRGVLDRRGAGGRGDRHRGDGAGDPCRPRQPGTRRLQRGRRTPKPPSAVATYVVVHGAGDAARTGSRSRPSSASAITRWSRRTCRPTTRRRGCRRTRTLSSRSETDDSSSWPTRWAASRRRGLRGSRRTCSCWSPRWSRRPGRAADWWTNRAPGRATTALERRDRALPPRHAARRRGRGAREGATRPRAVLEPWPLRWPEEATVPAVPRSIGLLHGPTRATRSAS